MALVLKRDRIITITLNRPRQRNALNEEVIHRLAEATDEAMRDKECRCLVVKGQGDHFCAGRDLGRPGLKHALLDERLDLHGEQNHHCCQGNVLVLAIFRDDRLLLSPFWLCVPEELGRREKKDS